MTQRGFTIIELVISIFILSVAVVGVFSVFSVMTILSSNATDRLAATYLVQEGMEIIRNIRDTNWLKIEAGAPGATWLDGLANCSGGCIADFKTTGSGSFPLVAYAGTDDDFLRVDNNGFYNHSSGSQPKFKRKITILCLDDAGQVDNSCNPADHVIKIITQVTWNQKATILFPAFSADTCGAYNCIKAQWTLYNWY